MPADHLHLAALLRPLAQDLESETAKVVARKEKERLRVMDKQRKEQLDRVRSMQNQDAALGEVGVRVGGARRAWWMGVWVRGTGGGRREGREVGEVRG